jgi:hypothetical protein
MSMWVILMCAVPFGSTSLVNRLSFSFNWSHTWGFCKTWVLFYKSTHSLVPR